MRDVELIRNNRGRYRYVQREVQLIKNGTVKGYNCLLVRAAKQHATRDVSS